MISNSIIQSQILAFTGLLKAAGLFFSKNIWPDQANGYTTNGAPNNNSTYHVLYDIIQLVPIMYNIVTNCPRTCNRLQVLF